ncbi:D-glycero-beta-D-manno-heptose 1,7-bisphosphate 7-phosphatase, partial [Chloroflexota bacterium]
KMRAIFLDRDGVICENRSDHVKSWQEFRFLPGAKESIAALSRLGLPIIVVTNQAAIGRNMVSAGVVEDIHRRMVAELAAYGGRIDRVIYCPHRPEDKCDCRKPEPGMLWQVAREMDIDLSRSYMIGDAATDLMAGQKVGCQTFLVLTGRGFQQLLPTLRSVNEHFTISRNLIRATTHILKAEVSVTDESAGSSLTYAQHYHQVLPMAGSF